MIEHLDMVLVYEPFTMRFVTTYKLGGCNWILAYLIKRPEVKLKSFREWAYTNLSNVSKQDKTA